MHTIIKLREKMDNIDSAKNKFYSKVDSKFKNGKKPRISLKDYLEEKKLSQMESEPSV